MKTGLLAAFAFWLVYTVLYMFYARIRGVRSKVRRAQVSVALDHGRRAPSPLRPILSAEPADYILVHKDPRASGTTPARPHSSAPQGRGMRN
jgi:hypothetical protein